MKEDIPRYIISQLGLTRDPLEGRTSLFLTSLPSLGLIVGFNKPIIKLSNKQRESLNGIVYHSVKRVFIFSLNLCILFGLSRLPACPCLFITEA